MKVEIEIVSPNAARLATLQESAHYSSA